MAPLIAGIPAVAARSDWLLAENLVAAFQGKRGKLFGIAHTAKDAQVLLEALEVGTDGVVLSTDDPAEVLLRLAS